MNVFVIDRRYLYYRQCHQHQETQKWYSNQSHCLVKLLQAEAVKFHFLSENGNAQPADATASELLTQRFRT